MISAIILAAGKSERMGAPKALLRFRDRTFLEHILQAVKKSRLESVVIVVGRHQNEIQQALPGESLVFNPHYEQGMSTSIQAGIRALPEDIEGAVLLLVDHPLIDSVTIDKLIDSYSPGSIIVPVCAGRRGHPVLFSRSALDEILLLGPDQGANTVLHKDRGRVIEVPVDDSGVLRDIDTPEDFAALLHGNSLS